MGTHKHRVPKKERLLSGKEFEMQCQIEALQQILDDTTAQLNRKSAQIVRLTSEVEDLKAIVKEYRKARDFWFEKHIKLERRATPHNWVSPKDLTEMVGCMTGRVTCPESNMKEVK